MNRHNYYENMKSLARETRTRYGIESSKMSLSLMRQIYREEGIKIDYWPHKLRKVRGAYLTVDGEACVLINAAIKPKEPRIFTLAHELKHHLADHELINQGFFACQEVSWVDSSPIEIGAEIYAAELIYPEKEFLELISQIGLSRRGCTAEDVVHLKRECPSPVSYTFLVKRLEWFRIVDRGTFHGVQFQKLEEQIYGVPFYKQLRS